MQSVQFIQKHCKYTHSLLAIAVLCMAVGSLNLVAASTSNAKDWVGTWACSPYPMGDNNTDMPPTISSNTVRQIVRVSIGGDTLRVKFSNKTCASSVTINSVNIAVSPDGTKSPVTASTITPLKFNGNASVTMNAKATATSDPVAFALTPSMRLAITIYYGTAGNGTDLTGHVASRTDSYVATGDQTANATFTGSVKVTAHWLHIVGIDVLADTAKVRAVVCFGNSITDGYGLSGGQQNRWTDAFSEKLLANPATAQVGVLNEGIGATNVASGSNSGISRYKQDVLGQSGVRWFIIFYGVNDINGGASASTITSAYQTMITDAHAKNIKVYGATITPFNGHSYYTTAHEQVRCAVNAWIRTSGKFDGVIDFDKAMRDPNDTTRFQAALKNDGLHPNAQGYKVMGESVDLKLFNDQTGVRSIKGEKNTGCAFGEIFSYPIMGNARIAFEIPHEAFVSLKVYSMHGKEVAAPAGRKFSSGKHTVEFDCRNLPNGMYVYSMTADKLSAGGKMILPGH